MTTAAPVLGHLTPFVERILLERVRHGEQLTPELFANAIRQAADEDNARIVRWAGLKDYEPTFDREIREAALHAMADAVYTTIRQRHASDPPRYNERWLACAADLGVSPDRLRPLDFICWRPRPLPKQ